VEQDPVTRSREVLRWPVLISFALASAAPTLAHEFCGTFLLIFYTDHIGLDPTWLGCALLIRMLIDAFVDPAIGHLSDRTTLRTGRRRPYFLIGSLPGTLLFFLVFCPPRNVIGNQFWYLMIVSSLMVVFLSVTEIPHMAMSFEITTNTKERLRVMGVRNFVALPQNLWKRNEEGEEERREESLE